MRNRKPWLPLVILFVILNALFLTAGKMLVKKGFDQDVLIAGNAIVFLATILSFYLSYRSATSSNVHASIRSLYGSFMIKFFIIIIAAFIYIMTQKKNINKPSLFTCMGLYFVYTVIEITSLQRLLRQQKNG
jgi:hypothetical protein